MNLALRVRHIRGKLDTPLYEETWASCSDVTVGQRFRLWDALAFAPAALAVAASGASGRLPRTVIGLTGVGIVLFNLHNLLQSDRPPVFPICREYQKPEWIRLLDVLAVGPWTIRAALADPPSDRDRAFLAAVGVGTLVVNGVNYLSNRWNYSDMLAGVPDIKYAPSTPRASQNRCG